MSKKTTNTEAQQPKQKQPAFVEDLLKNGTTTLTSLTREEFDAMLNDIPADVKYSAGAVGYNPETGVFSLRLDITNP